MISAYPALRQRMRESGISYRDLAKIAEVDTITLYFKMIGIKRWKLTEAVRICCFFNTQEVEHLFRKGVCFVRSERL